MSSEQALKSLIPKAIGLLAACVAVIVGAASGFRPGTILERALIVGFAATLIVWIGVRAIEFVGITVTDDAS